MERFYNIAGVIRRVIIPEGWTYHDDGVLSAYRTEGTRWDQTLQIEIVDRLPAPEGKQVFAAPGQRVYVSADVNLRYEGAVEKNLDGAYMCIRRQGAHSLVQVMHWAVKDCITQKLILTAMETEHHIVQSGGFLLHASYIRHGEGAILFTAPSGTGKSTQADLWCRLRNAELINGDRAAVVVRNGSALVHGIPYSGSSGVSINQTMPLQTIVRLTQAPETRIERMTGVNAFRCVWEGCCVNSWNRDDMSRCVQTAMDVIKCVPVFHLACTPDESAVIALEEALKN